MRIPTHPIDNRFTRTSMKNLIPMRLKNLLGILVIALTFIITTDAQQLAAQEPGKLTNQLNAYSGPDPWLTYYEGNYYLAATTGTSQWLMRKSPTLAGLKTAVPIQIYQETDPSRCCNFW